MAKTLLLVSLLLYIVVVEAAPVPVEWSAAASKSIGNMQLKVDKALNEVIAAAATPAERSEAEKASMRYKSTILNLLLKAKDTGDEKKAISIAGSYERAADMVIATPASKKSLAMERIFNHAPVPDATKCPNVDKSYCETYSKVNEALRGVVAAAPKGKKAETFDGLMRKGFYDIRKISKAYATGDDKEIARVLDAYNKAADAVIAAAPAEKLKVLEETFAAADMA
ncbi:hypothetical protein BS78_08G018600 [Paspalum vaginatum]|nr:hypothetical protein BS78_08G018600 [Paspalum vaginatum]